MTAMSLEAKTSAANQQNPLHNRLATLLEVDPAIWWRPTSENYFDRISKGSILALLNEVGGPAVMARHATLKKGEISSSCQKLFAGESIVEPEVKAAALAWVPDAMRFLDKPSANVEPSEPSDPAEAEQPQEEEQGGQTEEHEAAEDPAEEIDEAAEAA